MRTQVAVLAALMGAAVADPPLPAFPKSWFANEIVEVEQSGIKQMVEVAAYWQQDNKYNRTAYHVIQGGGMSTVSDYGVQKIWYILADRCQYYCDMLGDLIENSQDSLETYDMLHSAKYAGEVPVGGQTTYKWTWDEDLGPIVMNELALYTVPNAAVPVRQERKLTPFFKFIGWENTTWTNFTAGTPDPSAFVVPNEQYCERGSDEQCQDASLREAARVPGARALFLAALAKQKRATSPIFAPAIAEAADLVTRNPSAIKDLIAEGSASGAIRRFHARQGR